MSKEKSRIYRKNSNINLSKVHHIHPEINLSAKNKFIYAILLSILTFIISYILLFLWNKFFPSKK